MNRTEHWESIYTSKSDAELSWTQAEPRVSLELIGEACAAGRVIDVGGGNSALAGKLVELGYAVTVVDISQAALERARARLGQRADRVKWVVADIATGPSLGLADVWHDRAVFHFLTNAADRAAYRTSLLESVAVGGHAVMGTFALDGPEKCSGLEVRRYDAALLAAELGAEFALVKSEAERHLTPWGKAQPFQFSVFRRVS
jgi:SAM-dependent methyltransferase